MTLRTPSPVSLHELAGVRVPDWVYRAAGRQFASHHRFLRELFGPGDHSLVGCVVVQAMLGRGRVLLTAGERRGVFEVDVCGRTFIADFFADEIGYAGLVAINPRDEAYFELLEFFPQHLTLEEWDLIEHARFDRDSLEAMALQAKLLRVRRTAGLTRPRTPPAPGACARHPS